jgi:signal transduction histidine kinase
MTNLPPRVIGRRTERAPGQPLTNSTATQRRAAAIACLVMVVGAALIAPFAAVDVGVIPAFFPMYQTAAIGSCLITSFLLYAHFQAVGVVSLLHLSGGYLYTALVLIMQFIAFHGMLMEGAPGLGGSQTSAWLWLFWHLGPVLSIMLLAITDSRREIRAESKNAARVMTACAVILAAGATGLLVFGFSASLPVLDVGGDYATIVSSGLAPALQILLAATIAILWNASRFRNVLHVWLAIALVALFCDNAVTMLGGSRYTVGWYAGRLGALMGFSVLTLVYLWQLRSSYAKSVAVAEQMTAANVKLNVEVQDSQRHTEELERADLRKDEFLVMLAHELRNPLAPMSSAAHLLSVAPDDAKLVKETSEMLTRQVTQMSGLVEDLLDAASLARGVTTLREDRVDLKQVLTESIEQAKPLIDGKTHTLTVHMPDEKIFVAGDHRRLVQVFTNLLRNSAKYTPAEGLIQVQIHVAGGSVLVRVKDNGIGMSPDLMESAFQLFTQGAPAPHQPHGGLGIGLALVRRLVELHHGTVHATSRGEKAGTDMIVQLPTIRVAT